MYIDRVPRDCSLQISVPSDSGNAALVETSTEHVTVRILPDLHGSARQWFYLRVSGIGARGALLKIAEADQCSFPRGWQGYRAVVSTDRHTWRRAPTAFTGGQLQIQLPGTTSVAWVAAFVPFPLERHHQLVGRAAGAGARIERLGASLDGEDIDLIEVGDPVGEPIWIVARQHAGEAMAEWFAEGLIERLLDPDDALVRWVLQRSCVRVVPNMNPDGTRRGHLRANAAGIDLNRSWHAPDPARAPEVAAVLGAMDRLGVSLCLDIHGDETLPYCFAVGAGATPGWDEARASQQERFLAAWVAANPDLQTEHGYRSPAPGQANLRLCTNQVAERFGALALTLEQPFKDNALRPDPVHGWSPERSRQLGASVLHPIAAFLARR